ncbi:MAG: hypothetical protein ABIQ58_07620 [Candidatus Limnocylindrales bacterium]
MILVPGPSAVARYTLGPDGPESSRDEREEGMDDRRRIVIVAALALVSALVVGTLALTAAQGSPDPSAGRGSIASPGPGLGTIDDGAPITIRDFVFASGTVVAPTAQKAQSKLWYADSSWWAGLLSPVTQRISIFRLDWATQTWQDTGTVVDERSDADPDYLFADGHLYVATAGTRASASSAARILRFTFDPKTERYVRDPDFPVPITAGGTNAIVLDRDSLGTLWVTYVEGGRVMVAHSEGNDARWSAPSAVPGSGRLSPEDISAVVPFGDGRIGVMWSDQETQQILFASHRDGDDVSAWSPVEVVLSGAGSADNHLNLKTFELDGTRVVAAAVKTSLDEAVNPNPLASQVMVMIRAADGRWSGVAAGRLENRHSRPILLIDEVRRVMYVAAQSPFSGGAIYLKRASLDSPTFDTGVGDALVSSESDLQIANATSTKQSISPATGLVVMAADDGTDRFLHGVLDLGGTPLAAQVAQLPRPDLPEPLVTEPLQLINDSFDAWLPGQAAANGWVDEVAGGGTVAVDAAGGRQFIRLVSAAPGSSAETCKDFSPVPGSEMRVDVRFRISASGTADLRLATLRIPGGETVGLRSDGDGAFAYFDGATKQRTDVSLVDGRWYGARLDIDVAGRRADIRILGLNDTTVFSRKGVAWRTDKAGEPSRLCFRVSGAAATFDVDAVVVSR